MNRRMQSKRVQDFGAAEMIYCETIVFEYVEEKLLPKEVFHLGRKKLDDF